MKTSVLLPALAIAAFFPSCTIVTESDFIARSQAPVVKRTPPPPEVSFQAFYDELAPWGRWIDYPDYGYVWLPDAARTGDFMPYGTAGRWLLTDYGWTWASDYPWGWAPFHYGRWGYDPACGWYWVPDYQWGPGWVAWRSAPGYYGWTPLPPGAAASITYDDSYLAPPTQWFFVQDNDLCGENVGSRRIDPAQNGAMLANSAPVKTTAPDKKGRIVALPGPARETVQRSTGKPITVLPVREGAGPGQDLGGGRFQIYRPRITKSGPGKPLPAPVKVVHLNGLHRPARPALDEHAAKPPKGPAAEQTPGAPAALGSGPQKQPPPPAHDNAEGAERPDKAPGPDNQSGGSR